MTVLQCIDRLLHRYQPLGIELGLDHIRTLLAALGSPHQKMPVIHVAGSNGKGSVCAYVSAVLTTAGYRVGRYTSPYLVDWTDQICLNDRPIPPEKLAQSLQQVEDAIPQGLAITQFELLTATAWWIFAQEAVDIAVVEVGLGGRLDATNVCDRPLITAITSISLEHCHYLGPTLTDIAREKAGILKPGCSVVVGPLPAEAEAVVAQQIQRLKCPALWPQPARWRGTAIIQTLQDAIAQVPWAEVEDLAYPLPLRGEVQLTNSAVAIAILQHLRQQGWQITDEAMTQGMARTQWPGRLHWVQGYPTPLLLDGAHNPDAAQRLRQYVDQFQPTSVHWLMGMLATKDHRAILQALLRGGDRLTLVPLPDPRSADPSALADLATTVCPHLVTCEPVTLEAGWAALMHPQPVLEPAPTLKVLCGSLYWVGYFFRRYSRLPHQSRAIDI